MTMRRGMQGYQARTKATVPADEVPGLKVTETGILHQVRDYLRIHDWLVIRNQQGLGSHPGMTDLTAIRTGQVWWIEIKTAKGRVSEDQDAFRRDVQEHGGNWMLARGIEDVEELCRRRET